MTGRRTIVGLCMLSALIFSAVAAQSAMAISGTTMYTCKNVISGGGFKKEHCEKGDIGSGAYEDEEVGQDTTTEITGTNAKTNAETNGSTPFELRATLSGVNAILTATGVSATGSFENKLDPSGEHYITGTTTLTYTGVTTTVPKCKIFTDTEPGTGEEGVIHTRLLNVTSTEQGDALKFSPVNAEKIFATFEFAGAECALNGQTFPVTGSIKSTEIDGSTIKFTHADTTAQNTLKLGPNKAGINGSVTVSGKHPKLDANCTPLSVTTKTT